mmetsp:Transcript_87795/g.128403  ORF Transcript_87795/g.128403 Transcript_87795/m.128403 type:complete len:271 (-) Transcript_87795:51-863(-)
MYPIFAMENLAVYSSALAVVVPGIQVMCFFYGQELAGDLVPKVFGAVDRSVDLSQERFHTEFYDPLELRVQCATVLGALVLMPVFFFAALVMNEGVPLSALVKRAVISMFAGTFMAQATFTLFGAPLVMAVWKTLALSMLLGVTAVMPLGCSLGSDIKVWQRVISQNDLREAAEIQFYIPASFATVGAWLGAFPIPLDWDRPWQAWPITCTAGAVVGQSLGLLVVAVYFALQPKGREASEQALVGNNEGKATEEPPKQKTKTKTKSKKDD